MSGERDFELRSGAGDELWLELDAELTDGVRNSLRRWIKSGERLRVRFTLMDSRLSAFSGAFFFSCHVDSIYIGVMPMVKQ